MDRKELKAFVCRAEDEIGELAEEISGFLHENPELGDREFKASAFLAEKLREAGFRVTMPYLGLPTAFLAEYGNGKGPKVAFLAEYDALPGYGPGHDTPAHACGHNWIAASTAAAALSVAALLRKKKLEGTVYLIGTPGEETTGSKVTMAAKGAFDGLDGVFQCHLDRETQVDTKALAMTDFIFRFYGKSSHACRYPEGGINALDACELTLAGINALRQQLPPETRIHACYDCGGASPSIIPAFASLKVYVRDSDKDRLEEIISRVLDIGRGAELMTHARFEYTRAENTYYDLKSWPVLQQFMQENLESLGVSRITKGDIFHCVSSDIGNVSYACPTCYTTIGTEEYTEAGLHEEAFAAFAGSEKAKELMHLAAKAMAMSAADVLTNREHVGKIEK